MVNDNPTTTETPRKPVVRRTRWSAAEIVAAMRATGSNKTAAAARLEQAAAAQGHNRSCSRQLIEYYIGRSAKLKAALDGIFEETLDIAESVVLKNMTGQDAALAEKAAEFYLLTKGKGRGYTKQIEATGKDGGPILGGIAALTDEQLLAIASGGRAAAAKGVQE